MSDFTFTPDFVLDEEIEYKTQVSEFENGTEQRRKLWESPRRKFVLRFANRTLAELNAIKDFFVAKNGQYSSFTWTNPNDSVEYTVRFSEDSFKFTLVSFQVYNCELTLIEVK